MESQDLSANAENNSAPTHVRLDDDSEAKVSKKPTKNKRPPPVEDVEEDMEIVKVKKMKKAKVKSELVEDEEINIQVSLKPKSKKLKAEVKESN